jgi:hypothetical protein
MQYNITFFLWTTLGTRVWINQPKNVWNENLKMTHFTYLVIFHLKLIICRNVNLPHTYGHRLKKYQFVIWKLWNSSHSSQIYSSHTKSECLVDIKNFITIKNHFNPFLSILHFLVHCDIYIFWHKYILTSHHM